MKFLRTINIKKFFFLIQEKMMENIILKLNVEFKVLFVQKLIKKSIVFNIG